MAFKLKTKPKKPAKKDRHKTTYLDEGDSLEYIFNVIKNKSPNVSLGHIFVYNDVHNPFGDDGSLLIEWYEIESDEDYQKRLKSYQTKLKNYNKWAKENAEAIKAEKARLKQVKADEKRFKLEKKKLDIEKKLAKL